MQQYSTVPSRNLITAEREMLKYAEPIKVISTFGTSKPVPQNKTDTVVFRRPLPIDANAQQSGWSPWPQQPWPGYS